MYYDQIYPACAKLDIVCLRFRASVQPRDMVDFLVRQKNSKVYSGSGNLPSE